MLFQQNALNMIDEQVAEIPTKPGRRHPELWVTSLVDVGTTSVRSYALYVRSIIEWVYKSQDVIYL